MCSLSCADLIFEAEWGGRGKNELTIRISIRDLSSPQVEGPVGTSSNHCLRVSYAASELAMEWLNVRVVVAEEGSSLAVAEGRRSQAEEGHHSQVEEVRTVVVGDRHTAVAGTDLP